MYYVIFEVCGFFVSFSFWTLHYQTPSLSKSVLGGWSPRPFRTASSPELPLLLSSVGTLFLKSLSFLSWCTACFAGCAQVTFSEKVSESKVLLCLKRFFLALRVLSGSRVLIYNNILLRYLLVFRVAGEERELLSFLFLCRYASFPPWGP